MDVDLRMGVVVLDSKGGCMSTLQSRSLKDLGGSHGLWTVSRILGHCGHELVVSGRMTDRRPSQQPHPSWAESI